ncbi:E1 ubiquitin-activating protein uba2 [Aspergillus nanangensis]|uniref:E1 ubiquitin-activating protein uba2 n=1 Tax=Aspergillus nanangensis TaxID=2582783 RepID=A0AAD4CWW2_ASPNN|nr:E1 ubiquitin-activating protein uba2 [Aspergillus nanangensis]
MTAGLCVLQAFKVLKHDYSQAKMVFLERSSARAINSDSLNPPNPSCPVCSVAQATITVDPERATVQNLVEDVLRSQLGYGEDFSLHNDLGTFYDPDLDDNLPKKLFDLGVEDMGFITVLDEDDEPRVNLQLIVLVEKPEASADEKKPISLKTIPEIPRKTTAPKPATPPTNGQSNGASGQGKRKADDASLTNGEDRAKRVASVSVADGDNSQPIVLDEGDGGAILIDD